MRRERGKAAVLAAGLLLVSVAAARATPIVLTLETGTPFVKPGGTLLVDVNIAGLGDGVAPSLGTFDLDVSFDALLLGFEAVEFGLLLGVPGLGQAIVSSGAVGGVVDLAEVSFLSSVALDALQSDAFTLATIEFTVLAVGSTTLEFDQTVLGDGAGAPLASTSSDLTVVTPEIGTALLVGCGAVLLALLRRR